jgi:hypothetical protein
LSSHIAGPIRLLLYPLTGILGASPAPDKKPSATPHLPASVFAKQDAFVELLLRQNMSHASQLSDNLMIVYYFYVHVIMRI